MKCGGSSNSQQPLLAHHPYHRSHVSPSCSPPSAIPSPSFVLLTPAASPRIEGISLPDGVYERLRRQYLPELPKDPMVRRILVESLAHVMELEQQLEILEEQTRNVKKMKMDKLQVPEDLANVDVSEFKHLVLRNPILTNNITI